jgi:hypothetical protein
LAGIRFEEVVSMSQVNHDVKISGRIVDGAGHAIPNVKIEVELIGHQGTIESSDVSTANDGCFEYCPDKGKMPPAVAACLIFPKSLPPKDGRALVLRRGDRVEVPLCGTTRLADRVYETSGCQIHGAICREVVRDGCKQRLPFSQVPVELLDSQGVSHGKVLTCADGTFCFSPASARQEEYTLRFLPKVQIGADQYLLDPPVKDLSVVVSPGCPAQLCRSVCYTLASAEIVGQVWGGDRGLDGVCVTLLHDGTGQTTRRETHNGGSYRFEMIAPGSVHLLFECLHTDRKGQTWELPSRTASEQAFTLRAGDVQTATPVRYQPEEHVIEWFVRSDGKGVPGYLVELRSADGQKLLEQQYTDANGRVLFENRRGDFKICVYGDERTTVPPMEQAVTCNSRQTGETALTARVPASGKGNGSSSGGNGAGGAANSVSDLAAYPVLTEQINVAGGPAATSSPVGGTSLAQMVTGTLRDVLGWKPRAQDTKGFVCALTQSFACKEQEGHTVCTWVPRSSGALARPADLGAVTGAQLSIYTRAKVALDQSSPLLDGLYPLRPDVLEEDVEAIRSVVRTELGQVVDELGTVGGPRVARVDELFNLLLGNNPDPDPEQVGGQLQELRSRLGLERSRVNTIADEQNFTNFLILVDYVNTLNLSWQTERKYFTRGDDENAEPFLGTQLVLLSQSLAAAAEAVQDVNFTLESVFLGQPLQKTLELRFDGEIPVPPVPGDDAGFPKVPPMFVSELLDWVDRWTSSEAREMADNSGKDGVIALFPTANLLRKLVRATLIKANGGLQDPAGLPAGYSSARVQRTIQELATQLDEAARLAGQIVSREEGPRSDLPAQSLLDALQDENVLRALRQALAGSGKQKR